ncbi:unnamed protein product, partial [Phyllotreta striolata]
MNFVPKYIKTNVTAIKTGTSVTFIGIGANLHVFCNKSYRLLNKITVTDTRGQQIFGIIPFQSNKLLVISGNFLLIFNTNEDYSTINETSRAVIREWILEAKLLDDETKIATISMHNKINIWDTHLNQLESVKCEEKCLLYSAHLCYDNYNKLTALSGTVFNEVLIWKFRKDDSGYSVVLKRLQKHEGVIFSIHVKDDLICSTSDDRSAVLWKIESGDLHSELSKEHVNIYPLCQVFGHLSRVFKCRILNDCFVTGGEDSVLNVWSLNGKLKRKVETNQGSTIWSMDYDESKNMLFVGGDNGGVHAFTLDIMIKKENITIPQGEKPKLIAMLASHGILIFTESGILFVNKNNTWIRIKQFEDLRSCVTLKVSKCRKLVALAGFRGQLYIYKETDHSLENIFTYQLKRAIRITSCFWLRCDLLLVCQEGILTLLLLNQNEIKPINLFVLPKNVDCINTAIAVKENIIVGDRKGNIHLYKIGETSPVQSLRKVHNYLGVTNLLHSSNNLVSLGRNGTIKTFSMANDRLVLMASNKVPYNWLVDVIDNFLIGFSGDNFIIWNCDTKRILLDEVCGGGHRSWDLLKAEGTFKFLYIKEKAVNKLEFDINVNKSFDLVECFHLKEINCMSFVQMQNQYLLVSGGEDTTLRLSLIDRDKINFRNLMTFKSHLSSIRTIAIHKLGGGKHVESYLVFSAGGRAQIICWTLEMDSNNSEQVILRENHSYYEIIDNKESETRIMDLCVVELDDIFLFAACSDGCIKIFTVENNHNDFKMNLRLTVFYKLRCIFKVFHLKVFNKIILATLASDGCLVFWNVEEMLSCESVKPFSIIQSHQSGINTISKLQIDPTSFLFLTAGDDNTIVLNYLKFYDNEDIYVKVIDTFRDAGSHWAQITGSFIDNNYFLTASVDQRLMLYKWQIDNEKLICQSVSKYNSSIADLKGLLYFGDANFNILVYGLGIEIVNLVNK